MLLTQFYLVLFGFKVMINPLKDDLIPFTAIASRLDVHYTTVKAWHDRGELEAVRVGGRWFTTEVAFTAYVNREPIDQKKLSPERQSTLARDAASLRELNIKLARLKARKKPSRAG